MRKAGNVDVDVKIEKWPTQVLFKKYKATPKKDQTHGTVQQLTNLKKSLRRDILLEWAKKLGINRHLEYESPQLARQAAYLTKTICFLSLYYCVYFLPSLCFF